MTFKKFLISTIDLDYEDWVIELKNFNEIGNQLVNDLISLIQDTKWHPELFVLKHTWLVLQSLKEKNAENLYEAGLFHDWGKRYTTLVHRSRFITSYGHARYGAKMLDDIKEYLDEDDFETTRWIVKRHMDFNLDHKRFKQKDQYDEPYDLLEVFTWADKSRSRERFIESTNGMKEFQENVIVLNNLVEKILNKPKKNAEAELYIKIGSSGSGKSTCKTFNEENGYNIVCPDLIRKELLGYVGYDPDREDEVWETAKERIIELLAQEKNAVLDATNVNRYSRTKFIAQIVNDHTLRNKNILRLGILYPFVDKETARERIENDLETKDRSDVPINVIRKQNKNLKDSYKEGFSDLHFLIKPVKSYV